MAGTPRLYNKSAEDNNLELRLGPPWQRKSPEKGFSGLWSNEGQLFHHLDENKISTAVTLSRTIRKRSSPAPVVGWPPVGSFRKNIANNCPNKEAKEETSIECKVPATTKSNKNHLFVKIYMDGFPIGRKLNLRAYDSYEKLSFAIDELFGGLVLAAAQMENGNRVTAEEDNADGECTLIYEDNEGDRMLVGDVPWNMFVSTAKKLRVLRSYTQLGISSSDGEAST